MLGAISILNQCILEVLQNCDPDQYDGDLASVQMKISLKFSNREYTNIPSFLIDNTQEAG